MQKTTGQLNKIVKQIINFVKKKKQLNNSIIKFNSILIIFFADILSPDSQNYSMAAFQ